MEILAVKLQQIDHPFASGKVWQMTVQTNYEPAEIIVIRPDGTSESTDPEALRLRESKQRNEVLSQYLHGRTELEPEVKRLHGELVRANDDLESKRNSIGRLQGENNRLESELKAANDELQALKADVNYSTFIEVASERDQLKRQLERLEEKRELKERLQGEVLRLETLRDVRQALGCTFGDVVAAARGMVQHDTKMCQIICRISDKIGCRSGDVETGVANLFDGYNTQHAELSQAKADYAGLAKRHDELSAINVENFNNAMEWARKNASLNNEIKRLKTQFSPPMPINWQAQTFAGVPFECFEQSNGAFGLKICGLTIDEVKGLKADRDEIAAKLAAVFSALSG